MTTQVEQVQITLAVWAQARVQTHSVELEQVLALEQEPAQVGQALVALAQALAELEQVQELVEPELVQELVLEQELAVLVLAQGILYKQFRQRTPN
jgi:hypothetical protein